jgi:hypothetical protein
MKSCVAIALLVAGSVNAAPSQVQVYAGYSLRVVEVPGSVQFDIPGDSEALKRLGLPFRIYADREALAAPGTVRKCELVEFGGPAFPSTSVRVWLLADEAERIKIALTSWLRSMSSDRTLVFVRQSRLVHGHDPALATISESTLYLQVGPRNEAQAVLEAICGDA